MKTIIILLAVILIFTQSAFCADIVQISDTRDNEGKWINWIEQTVTWDLTLTESIPDHYPVTTKAIQTWAFPVENGWIKASFTRNKIGVYALRWSHDGILWSDPSSVNIEKPGNPQNNKG